MHALSIQHIPFFFTYFLGSLKKFYSFYFFLFLSLHAISFRIVRKLYLISFPSQLSFHQSILFQIISNFHSFLTSWSWRLSSSPVQSHPSTLASRWSNFDPDSSRESSKTEGREAASERNRIEINEFETRNASVFVFWSGSGLFFDTKIYVSARRLETMRSMKWPGGKLNEWFSSQGAPLNNLPAVLPFLPSLSSPFPPFRQIVIHPESSENRYERNFLFPSFSSFF